MHSTGKRGVLCGVLAIAASTASLAASPNVLKTLPAFDPTAQVAQVTAEERTRADGGSIAVIGAYEVTAERRNGGTIVLSGYAPDRDTIASLAQITPIDSAALKLAEGAPRSYQAALTFGLQALSKMSDGTFRFSGDALSLRGNVAKLDDYLPLLNFVVDKAPAGLADRTIDVQPPRVDRFTWTATKAADGAVTLAGFVPDPATRQALAAKAGTLAGDQSLYADGEPADFAASAEKGLALLAELPSGTLRYDGAAWSLSADVQTQADADAAQQAVQAAQLPPTGWTVKIATAEPEAAPPVTQPPPSDQPPAVDPDYHFAATKPAGGPIALSGQVPADAALRYFGVVAGDVPTTNLVVAPGVPENFALDAVGGLRALSILTSGELKFAAGQWSLSGDAASDADRKAILAAIAALPGGAAWQVAITQPPMIDACRGKVAELAARNAILFKSGSAQLAEESALALDELAADLALCPEALVYVEGHTDSDGDANANLSLSVARAEAVIAALVQRGIAASRLYAVGYGETMPIASNDTRDGKALNRRIGFTLSETELPN